MSAPIAMPSPPSLTESSALPTASADSIPSSGGATSGPSFGDVVSGFLNKVDGAQQHSDKMVEALALGEPVEIHDVMLALNEASNAMQLTLQVRSKILDAYQQLMQTQM